MEPDFPDNPLPITHVTAGMQVIDADGEDVGLVDLVRLGDADAVTVQAPVDHPGDEIAGLVDSSAADEPDVPADLAARLARTGFLKVDGADPFDMAVYVAADQIAEVGDGVVQLNVGMEDLIPEE